jgi:hypothetical protein
MLPDLISMGCIPSIFVAVFSWDHISSEELWDEGEGCFHLSATLKTSTIPSYSHHLDILIAGELNDHTYQRVTKR